MRRSLAAIVVALAAAAAVGAGTASGQGITFFQTPSKNIGCIYVAPQAKTERPYLRCDIGTGLRPMPPRPKGCDLDWGHGYSMRDLGRARALCAGDTAKDPRAPVLAYGRTWRRGPFTCTSRTIGLRCTNRDRHGFFLSRQRSYTF